MTETLARAAPGIKSVKDLPILQDGPPPGGFPAIRIERRLPSTGPTGVTIFAVVVASVAYGYYRIYGMTKERRAYKQEKKMTQAALVPYLQAETDRMYMEARRKELQEEAKIMAKVPGWKVGESTLSEGKWLPPMPAAGIWNPVNL